MTIINLTLQVVNGDPATTGGNINITTATFTGGFFDEAGSVSLSTVESNDVLTINGLDYQYEYLGSHNVRGNPNLPAAYIRIIDPLPAGATLSVGDTFAIDLTGQPGDPDYPNLPNGNTKGTVASLDTTTPIQFPGFACFTRGTKIDTPSGEIPIELLRVGDQVITLDGGPQDIVWIGSRRVAATGSMTPIEFAPGVLGNTRRLRVSPQHRMLLSGWRCELLFACDEVLVAAKHLLPLDGVREVPGGEVDYFHILFEQHEIVISDGAYSESLLPNLDNLDFAEEGTHDEIRALFPELFANEIDSYDMARTGLRQYQAHALLHNGPAPYAHAA